MKQIYEAPVVEIELLETKDVLAISIVTDGKGELTEIEWSTLQ